jgi:thioredoxin reductase
LRRTFDVIVIGGGAAGMSAALMLGRCRFSCLVVDDGKPRNAAARAVHGFLTRDGISPTRLLEYAQAEVRRYGVEMRRDHAASVMRTKRGFTVRCRSGFSASSSWLVLATGIRDVVPDLPGFRRMYGTSVHHCPFCDGWEHRDRKIAVFAPAGHGPDLCRRLLSWSSRVTLLTHGWAGYRKDLRELEVRGIEVVTTKVAALEGRGSRLRRVRFVDESATAFDALFFTTGAGPSCDLAKHLGCRVSKKGIVMTDREARAGARRIYVVGDASRDSQLLAIAVAEGAKAALAIQADWERDSKIQRRRPT